jgi:cupin fold WbuC family metalloprotein
MNKTELMPGVFVNAEMFPAFSESDLKFCLDHIDLSPTKRARICMHKETNDRMQEMFIAFDGATYVRPSYHQNKDESFHMIEGVGKYVFFDKNGVPNSDVRLGSYDSDLPFYCRIPGDVPHTLVVYSNNAVAHEVGTGPFKKEDTIFPPWSIDLDSDFDKNEFRQSFAGRQVDQVAKCKYKRVTEEMCRAESGVVSVSRADLEYLKSEVSKTSRKRIRLCIHQSDEALMHEMFVIYTGATYVRANKHLGKDESLHILEGEADFIFFDDEGRILDVIELGARHSGKDFFIRVPQGIFHTIIMRSPIMVIHEATPGPFDRTETKWAEWSPEDSDENAVDSYMTALEINIREFKSK